MGEPRGSIMSEVLCGTLRRHLAALLTNHNRSGGDASCHSWLNYHWTCGYVENHPNTQLSTAQSDGRRFAPSIARSVSETDKIFPGHNPRGQNPLYHRTKSPTWLMLNCALRALRNLRKRSAHTNTINPLNDSCSKLLLFEGSSSILV